MNKKKACKRCRMIVEGGECPICKGNTFAAGWNGRVIIIDPAHSTIAQRMGAGIKGEYAIKIK